MEIEARRKGESPVIFTMVGPHDFRKGMTLNVSGLMNNSMNGDFTITKVRRHWMHWYDPIVVFFQQIGLKLRMLYWRMRCLVTL